MSAEIFFQKHNQRTDFPNICHVLLFFFNGLQSACLCLYQRTSNLNSHNNGVFSVISLLLKYLFIGCYKW